MSNEEIREKIAAEGYCIIPNVLSQEFVQLAKRELMEALRKEDAYHETSERKDAGMVLLCSLYGGSMLGMLENEELWRPFEAVLGEGSIVYAYTSSSMPPGKHNYSSRIHVDCPRLIPGYVTNMGATILLDDFHDENGATWFLPASQNLGDPPSQEYFFGNAKRLIAPAGSVWYFNARLWHAGGSNSTKEWRHALTLNVCRPFMKQRIDIPRAMGAVDVSSCSRKVLQKLGYFSQVPANYDEYYAPPERRKYQQNPE